MFKLPSGRIANLIGFVCCAGMIAYALFAQYVLLLDPCPLCLFQRFAVIGLGLVFLVATIHDPKSGGQRVYAVLLSIAALIGIGIAVQHLWIQAQPPGSVPSCGASLGYLFEIMSVVDVIKKVFSGSGECAKVDVMLGLSWPWWTIIAMTVLGTWGVVTNWLRR
jgi:disulfide bond formation protein DsbB